MTVRTLIAILTALPPELQDEIPTVQLAVTDNDGAYAESGPLLGIEIASGKLLFTGRATQ